MNNNNENFQEEKNNNTESQQENEMKNSICSFQRNCKQFSDFNEGEINKKIDALNLQYNYESNESKSSLTDKDSNYTDFYNKSSHKEDESIHLNEQINKEEEDQQEEKEKNEICGKKEQNKTQIQIKNEIPKKESNKNVLTHSNKFSEFEVINQDHYLKPFERKIKEKLDSMKKLISDIEKNESSLIEFSQGYKKMGFNLTDEGITFREYAPCAKSMSLVNFFLIFLVRRI